jgi:general secretion pathway protein G
MLQKGYTLIELLVVVTVIGILAAIAIPNLMNALNRSRQKRTMADMRAISEAIEMYHQDLSVFPEYSNVSAEQLREPLRIYVKQFNGYDGWNNAFMYDSDGDNYTLLSRGSDGLSDGSWGLGGTVFFRCDIVFSGGAFMQWPEGIQR